MLGHKRCRKHGLHRLQRSAVRGRRLKLLQRWDQSQGRPRLGRIQPSLLQAHSISCCCKRPKGRLIRCSGLSSRSRCSWPGWWERRHAVRTRGRRLQLQLDAKLRLRLRRCV